MSIAAAELWEVIAGEAARESSLWAEALRSPAHREAKPVFSPLAEERFALGIETIYEGYLLHYAQPRLFGALDRDTSLLLGDYLYAHGLVRISALDDPAAVGDLAELISVCAHLRAEGAPGDGAAWAATASLLGRRVLDDARRTLRDEYDPGPLLALANAAAEPDAVGRALASHAARLR